MKAYFILFALFFAGCSKDALYFGTYTRVGIDASTDGAGIGLKNSALNIARTREDGRAFDILGSMDMDLGYTYVIIDEKVAVGDAAKCAAMKEHSVDAKKQFMDGVKKPAVGPVIFGAYTSWSLVDLSWGDAGAKGINFGYKRGVGVRMPIVNDQVGSVYAHVSVNSSDNSDIAKKSVKGGVRHKQVFATGDAAIIKASGEAAALNESEEYNGCIPN